MRFKSHVLAIGLAAFALAAPVSGQRSDDQIAPRSVELQKQGEAHLAAQRLSEATDALETALAVDPRNRSAFVLLARVAQQQKLHGKAVRLTNRALQLEPNDVSALGVQGEAMAALGATARAQANLQKLKTLCVQGCPQLTSLTSALSRASAVAVAKPIDQAKTN